MNAPPSPINSPPVSPQRQGSAGVSSPLGTATLVAASALTVMAGATIAPSLPAIEAAFADDGDVGLLVRLVLTLPAIFTAVGAPIAGVLLDRFGRRGPFLLGLVLYAAAGTAGLWVPSLTLLLVSRALLGIAVGLVMTSSTTLITDLFDGAARNRVMGIQGSAMAAGGVLFLLLGGALANQHWRAPFGLYLASVVILGGVLAFVPEPERARRADGGGQGAFPGAWVATLFVVGLVGMIVFYAVPTQLPFHLRQLIDASPMQTGMAIAGTTLFSAFTSALYGQVRQRLSFLSVFAVLFGLMGLGFVLLAQAGSLLTVFASLAICGVGMGLLMPNTTVLLGTVAPPALRGRLMGLVTMSFFIGQFVSPLVMQPIIDAGGFAGSSGAFAVGGYLAAAMGVGFAVVAISRRASPPAEGAAGDGR